jgi:hypothetical protein
MEFTFKVFVSDLTILFTVNLGIGILFHRVVIKGHGFMDYNPAKGYLRPKPMDSMLLFLTLFNICECLSEYKLFFFFVTDVHISVSKVMVPLK